ncbi:hypothetical protein CSUI_004495 [Cystoisospora suis]|uniref:Uncharacterized protein n=1 Tax=Cystoisospora suis TaxID=483139 RepID=A0A2C6KX40_9APIC|nr:hypothetical protein CSUI_004495 [Cystoisospora suis]
MPASFFFILLYSLFTPSTGRFFQLCGLLKSFRTSSPSVCVDVVSKPNGQNRTSGDLSL